MRTFFCFGTSSRGGILRKKWDFWIFTGEQASEIRRDHTPGRRLKVDAYLVDCRKTSQNYIIIHTRLFKMFFFLLWAFDFMGFLIFMIVGWVSSNEIEREGRKQLWLENDTGHPLEFRPADRLGSRDGLAADFIFPSDGIFWHFFPYFSLRSLKHLLSSMSASVCTMSLLSHSKSFISLSPPILSDLGPSGFVGADFSLRADELEVHSSISSFLLIWFSQCVLRWWCWPASSLSCSFFVRLCWYLKLTSIFSFFRFFHFRFSGFRLLGRHMVFPFKHIPHTLTAPALRYGVMIYYFVCEIIPIFAMMVFQSRFGTEREEAEYNFNIFFQYSSKVSSTHRWRTFSSLLLGYLSPFIKPFILKTNIKYLLSFCTLNNDL